MVSASTGATNSLLTKLATLTGEQYAELTGAGGQELILRDEIQVMKALLKQLSETSELNIEMEECRNQMRELTYDIDDSIDDLMLQSVSDKGSGSGRELTCAIKDSIDALSVIEKGSGSTGKRVMPHDFIKDSRGAVVKRLKIESMPTSFMTRDLIDQISIMKIEKDSGSSEKGVMPHDFIGQIQKLNKQVEKAHLPSMVRKIEKRAFGPSYRAKEQWMSEVYDELIKPAERDQPSVEWTKEKFDMSYSGLSSDMKTCLLYLSIFRANHVIKKDRLIRRWAAEGFLPKRSVETWWWETGESYFFELIARTLIEPVYDDEDEDILPTGCKVSGFVHDSITSLSIFFKPGQHGVFSRLSVSHGPYYEEWLKLDALFKEPRNSKVRSLILEGGVGYRGIIPNLRAFKHVRVLDLEGIKRLEDNHLPSIGVLSLLRYLGLFGTIVRHLPKEIIALEHLETIDLRRTRLRELPAFKSQKLVCLLFDKVTLKEGMGEMQGLEELSTVHVGNFWRKVHVGNFSRKVHVGKFSRKVHVVNDCDRFINLVNQSKRLRKLGVEIEERVSEPRLRDLLGAIGNSNIQSLCISAIGNSNFLDLLLDCWANKRPRHLQELKLRIYSTRREVPRNMLPSLIDLTHLRIRVQRVDTEALRTLGNLPNLVSLSLNVDSGLISLYTETMTERSIISKNGFRRLRVFECDCGYESGMRLQFEAGAMPQLRKLQLEFNVNQTESEFGGADFGVQFLTCLVQFRATINCYGSKAASVEAAEAAMRDQVSHNPNNPVLEIRREGERWMEQDEGQSSYVDDPMDFN